MPDLPDKPVALFQLFCPVSLVEKWVLWTNESVTALLLEKALSNRASLRSWKPISVAEVYVWLAILIYIGIHPQNRIRDHWVTSRPGSLKPTHPIIKWMTYARFTLIFRYIRIFPSFEDFGSPVSKITSRISEWSDHIQSVSTQLFVPGIHLAVDEYMIRYTGRSTAKATIPRKPIPTGIKLWVCAQEGYFLRWRVHIPLSARPRGPRGLLGTKRAQMAELAETQAVVLDLVTTLPIASYHVFFDNLFSTPQLIRALRQRGIAATGTARINSGIHRPFVVAKVDDNAGKLRWSYNELRAVPTDCDQIVVINFGLYAAMIIGYAEDHGKH
ncbi:hypothetical protein S40293_05920 [Stachybotrys chartarum IBT 40293]|nr:hypothetical protein S40293_05920 [Stachybotrys chartarum IBT 40293]